MGHTRRNHPPGFKAKVVLEMLTESRSIAEISAEYGVHPTQLHRWRKQAIESLPQLFARQEDWAGEKAQLERTIEDLYTQIGRLSTQLSWLKKKGLDVDSS